MVTTHTIDGVKIYAYGFKDFSVQEAQLYLDYVLENVIFRNGDDLRSISLSLRKDSKVTIRVTSNFGLSKSLLR